MMETDGVVEWLPEALDERDFATRIDGGAENNFLKKVQRHVL